MQLDLQEPFWKVGDAAKDFVIVCVEQPEDGFDLRPGSIIRGRGWILAKERQPASKRGADCYRGAADAG